MTRRVVVICTLVFLSGLNFLVYAQTVSDYLVLNNIGEYIFRPNRIATIEYAGVLVPTGHFQQDHGDMTYEGIYIHPQTYVGVEVKITQHTGSDSDQWLLHEIEDSYRDGDDKDGRLGLIVDGTVLRRFGTDRTFLIGIGGGHFRWPSNNIVIDISYTDLDGTKPQPLEIIQAYLAKFPSTLPATLVLDSAHEKQWIRDEITRRLWLCDKWLAWQNAGNADVPKMVRAVVGHLNVFLNYRQKYYGISSKDDKRALDGYMLSDNKTEIQKKLTEYKQWWAAHKNDSITLP